MSLYCYNFHVHYVRCISSDTISTNRFRNGSYNGASVYIVFRAHIKCTVALFTCTELPSIDVSIVIIHGTGNGIINRIARLHFCS